MFNKLLALLQAFKFHFIHLRDPPEPTGDEPDDFEFVAPKIYEIVSCMYMYIFC